MLYFRLLKFAKLFFILFQLTVDCESSHRLAIFEDLSGQTSEKKLVSFRVLTNIRETDYSIEIFVKVFTFEEFPLYNRSRDSKGQGLIVSCIYNCSPPRKGMIMNC